MTALKLSPALLRDVDGIVYVSAHRPFGGSDYYYSSSAMGALEIDEPGLLAELNKQEWAPNPFRPRPGEICRQLERDERWFYSYRWFCQDCQEEDFTEVMLQTPLWNRLYPDDGHACPSCMEKRLGRPLTPEDCNNSLLSQWYWRERHELQVEERTSRSDGAGAPQPR